MELRQSVGAFLQARRSRLSPDEVGLPTRHRHRRVTGLRREEVANLAGISVEYYQRLEQNRTGRPSIEVIDGVADALRLSAAERRYLSALARPPGRRVDPVSSEPDVAWPGLRTTVDRLTVAALVITDRFDVLASNAAGRRLFGLPDARTGHPEPNLAEQLFLDRSSRAFYVDWHDVASTTVAQLQVVAVEYPDDPQLARLVGRLHTESASFAELWQTGNVDLRTHGTKAVNHPEDGRLYLRFEHFNTAEQPRMRLVTFTPVDPADNLYVADSEANPVPAP